MKYRIDYCEFTNITGVFLLVPPGTYPVTAKNSVGCISSVANVTIYEPVTWTGLISSDWNDGNNWSGGFLPTCKIVIPDGATTNYDPVLPLSPAASGNTIIIESGGILNGGSATTITLAGGGAAWQNMGTFNSGTSTVIFANSNATIADPTDFFNVTIASGAGLTPQSENIMRIAGALKLEGTGVLNAALLPNTIEFNGTDQIVINPNGTTPGYYNLILSGSGAKTLPGSALSVAGDFTITGTTTTTLAGATTVEGDLTIGNGTRLSIAPSKSLTVSGNVTNNAGTSGLVIESAASGTGSLIHYAAGVSASIQRYMSGNRWHIIGTPVSEQSIPDFITNISNTIPVNGTDYGMMYYSEPAGGWVYYTNPASGNLSAGTGYLLRHEADDAVTLYGTMNAALTSVAITRTPHGWNCIGNPFPCSIGVRSDASTAENFIAYNLSQLDPSFAVLYLWDEPAVRTAGVSYYSIIGNAGFTSARPAINQTYLQPGQGFFVKSKEAAGTVSFTTGMRIHENAGSFFKSANVSWPGINLNVTSATKSASTAITLHEGMTTGLDVSYDAGLMGGDPAFSLYSRLVDDIGVNFMLQCLPDDGFDNIVIPIGFDCADGGTVTFTADIVPLPSGITAILADNLLEKYTNMQEPSATYTAGINPNTSGTGRFFLNISRTATFANKVTDGKVLTIYSFRKEIIVKGKVKAGTSANLYDLAGRLVRNYKLSSPDINTLPAEGIQSGIYILQVFGDGLNQNSKLFLK